MSWKTWAPLLVAIGLGLAAAVSAKQWMARQNQAKKTVQMRSVVVAAHDVAPGSTLSQTDLKLSAIPADVAAPGTFEQVSALVGRVVTTPIAGGQAIVAPLLAPQGHVGGLASLIPEGMRAVTLEINEFSGVGGLLIPGCHVDVLATLRPDREHDPVTRTIAQNLKVIAVGQSLKHRAQADRGNSENSLPRSVTVLATPKQAELIQMATQNARPWLMLRGGDDDTTTNAPGVTLAELRGNAPDVAKNGKDDKNTSVVRIQMPATRPAEANAQTPDMVRQTVQLIRGASESQVIFEMPSKAAPASKSGSASKAAPASKMQMSSVAE